MKNKILTCFILLSANVFAQVRANSLPEHPSLPDLFVENKGQMTDADGRPVPSVLFKQETPGVNLFITEQGITYLFLKCEEEEKEKKSTDKINAGKSEEEKIKWERVDMVLKNAVIKKENIIKEGMRGNFSQYFLGHCPSGIKDVHGYEKVTIKNVYPNIDWIFYNSSEKGAKYDFVVHPGANPNDIQLLYSSKEKLTLTADGALQIKTSYGNLRETAPESFLGGKPIKSKFKMISRSKNNLGGYNNLIAFDFSSLILKGRIGRGLLVIDPQLFWSTFFGGTGFDGPRCVTTDNAGNVYVCGYTESANFPTQTSGTFYQGTFAGGVRDAFIQKFNNAGVRLWATYYGGSLVDEAWHMAFDANDNLFIIGYTESANFPTQNSGTFFQGTYSGQGDAIILKFDNAGNRLWATYYGGTGMEEGFGITTDPNGNIFLTGETRSNTTFPLQNAGTFYQGTFGTGVSDAFILKFDNAGNRLWATYAGGWNTDMGNAIATDANGNVFVTGYVWGGGFPLLNSGTFFQGAITGSGDIFIMKFDNTGNLLWSTYYGGGAVDEGNSIAVDASGNIFITGSTASSAASFPLQNPGGGAYYQPVKGGTWDTYMLKFDNAGNRLWATFFGGSGAETTKEYTYDNLAIDDCGNVYMSCETTSSDIPVLQSCDGGFYNGSFLGGTYDLHISQFSNTGVLLWATYLGGNGDDFRSPMALDDSNSLFMSGEWTDGSPLNPATYPNVNPGGGAYNATFAGGHDGYMVKFDKTPPALGTSQVNATCGCDGTATAIPGGLCAPFTYSWNTTPVQTTQTATGLCAGTYSVAVSNQLCGTISGSVTITSSGGFSVTATSAPASCGSNNGSATATPSGGQSPYTYAWSPSGGTTSSATGLSAGNYTVTITDGNGCTNTTVLTITSTGGPTLSVSSVDPLCNGGINGTATASPSGGSSPYTYLWNNSQTTQTATGLSSGNYTVTVTDANGCTSTQTVSLSQPAAITTTISSTPSVCGSNNGTAAVAAAGGSGSYTYSWNPSSGTSSSISNLGSGNYSVTITDVNGCTSTATVSVTSSNGPNVTANTTSVSCFGGNNGTSSVNVTGGTSPYTYNWNNGQTTSAATNLAGGSYTVIITDAGGCTNTQVVSISQPTAIAASAVATPASCGASDGTASVSASGGTLPYIYIWSNGQTASSISNLASGNFSVTITDANGCTQTATVSVATTGGPTANVGADVTITVGSSATLTAGGGGNYLWSNGDTSNIISVTPTVTTIYCVTVTDANNCSDTACATVSVIVELTPCTYKEEELFIPDAFSPNGDGRNESMGVYYPDISCIRTFQFIVYDRWGEKIYEADEISAVWDGTYKGKPMNTAVFVYYMRVNFTTGDEVIRKGNVSLIR